MAENPNSGAQGVHLVHATCLQMCLPLHSQTPPYSLRELGECSVSRGTNTVKWKSVNPFPVNLTITTQILHEIYCFPSVSKMTKCSGKSILFQSTRPHRCLLQGTMVLLVPPLCILLPPSISQHLLFLTCEFFNKCELNSLNFEIINHKSHGDCQARNMSIHNFEQGSRNY